MSLPTSIATAEHYTWGDLSNPCDGWYLLQTPELSVIEERMPPGASEQRHLHKKSRQFFYVLWGEFTMECGGLEYTLRAGEAIEIAPGLAHKAINRSQADTRILVTSQPPSHEDRSPA
jgi:uncharacterized cupin superfamily protein